jgi:hypothetical protein
MGGGGLTEAVYGDDCVFRCGLRIRGLHLRGLYLRGLRINGLCVSRLGNEEKQEIGKMRRKTQEVS